MKVNSKITKCKVQGLTLEYTGCIYKGEFKDTCFHGQGSFNSPRRSYLSTPIGGYNYEGEWKENKYHGQGTLTESDGNIYEGDFKNGKKNGQGTLTFPDGEKSVGEFKDGKLWNGKGTQIITFGGMEGTDKYEGEFKNGQWHGHGTHITYNGLKYEGEYKNGMLNGQGKENIKGAIYEGEYKDGRWNGIGIYTFSNGKYEGEFEDGTYNGQGTFTESDGTKYVGEFNGGKKGIFEFTFINTPIRPS